MKEIKDIMIDSTIQDYTGDSPEGLRAPIGDVTPQLPPREKLTRGAKGRYTITWGERRTARMHIYMTPALHEWIHRRARALGISINTYIELLADADRRNIEEE